VADTLRELPWWDKIFIDRNSWTDDDLVLETRAANWHTDPVTHEVSITHMLIGEDGVEEFTADELLPEGTDIDVGTQIHAVQRKAEMPWTQQGVGSVDLTEYIRSSWPNEDGGYYPAITSFTMNEQSWPKPGASMKDGWVVASATAIPVYDLTVKSHSVSAKARVVWEVSGQQTTVDVSKNDQYVGTRNATDPRGTQLPPGTITLPVITTQDETTVQRSGQSDEDFDGEITGGSHSDAHTSLYLPLYHTNVTLTAGYEAQRPFTEIVTMTLVADLQPVITAPDDSQVLIMSTLKSVNLSEILDEDNYEGAPIGVLTSRSYVTQARGELSIQYVALTMRAALIEGSRAATVTIQPISLARMADITLRKNVLAHDPKIPGGQALGKVIEWESSYSDGKIENKIVLGCCLGHGGTVVEVPGEEEYVDDEYVDESEDWQQYIGGSLLVADETDLLYSPPLFAPNDDGLELRTTLLAADVIDEELSVENYPAIQRFVVEDMAEFEYGTAFSPFIVTGGDFSGAQASIDRITRNVEEQVNEFPTIMRFSLKSMKASFRTEHVVELSQLKMPKMIDLES
jgi:hypothetical protein